MIDKNRFNILIQHFEAYIDDYTFKRYDIGSFEKVYIIEDYAIEYLSVSDRNYGRLVIEELFNTGYIDLKLNRFEKREGTWVQFSHFRGTLGS